VQALAFLLTCCPLMLTAGAWMKVYRQHAPFPRAALVALGIVTGNAALAAASFLYYEFRPDVFVAPWQDRAILGMALLLLSAPIGMVAGNRRGCTRCTEVDDVHRGDIVGAAHCRGVFRF
jgi:hypothetical protein